MRYETQLRAVRVAVLLLLSILLSCRPFHAGPVKVKPGVRYDPPIVPISITLSSEGVAVSIEGRLKTPFGTFSALAEVDYPADKRLLVISLADETFTYELDDRSFQVALPNDLYASSTISYRGGNIIVIIPHPVTAAAENTETTATTAATESVADEAPSAPDTADTTTTEDDTETEPTPDTTTAESPPLHPAPQDIGWYVVTIQNHTGWTLTYNISDGVQSVSQTAGPGTGWRHWFRNPGIELRFEVATANGCACLRYTLSGERVMSDPATMSNPPSHEYSFVSQDGRLMLADAASQ